MNTTISRLVMILTVAVSSLVTTSFACGGGGNKGGGFSIGYSKNGFGVGIGVGGGHKSNLQKKNYHNNGNCQYNGGLNGQPNGGAYAFEPYYSYYICQPGDNFYTVSLKNYGTSGASKYVALFNRLPLNAALVPGQRLNLPAVTTSGRLTQSRAPAPFIDATSPTTFPNGTAKASSPATSKFASSSPRRVAGGDTKPAATEPALPKVTVGSTLLVDGQEFGEETGVARLRVSGLSLPIEVLEWSDTSAKIRLPEVEVTSATNADIEVLRADGSLAAKSGIELTPAETKLAQKN